MVDFQQQRCRAACLSMDQSNPHTRVQLSQEARRLPVANQTNQSPHCDTEIDSYDEAIACAAAPSVVSFQQVTHTVHPPHFGGLLSRAAPSLLVASRDG